MAEYSENGERPGDLPPLVNGLLKGGLWFVLTLGTLVGLGVDPVTAARFAFAPFLLVGLLGVALSALIVLGRAPARSALLADLDHVHENLEELRSALQADGSLPGVARRRRDALNRAQHRLTQLRLVIHDKGAPR